MNCIALDVHHPNVVPYFNWDTHVTNAQLRRTLLDGTEEDKVFWTARIMREARFADVWEYVSLRRDVLPRWDLIAPLLGRSRDKWTFLIRSWQARGLI